MPNLVGFLDVFGAPAIRKYKTSNTIIDSCLTIGYDLIEFPMLEQLLESQNDADLFKLIDPVTGKIAILTPDITRQIIRFLRSYYTIDTIKSELKLCYVGKVARLQSTDPHGNRCLSTCGMEIVNVQNHEKSITEILTNLLQIFEKLNISDILIELGNPNFSIQSVDQELIVQNDLTNLFANNQHVLKTCKTVHDQFKRDIEFCFNTECKTDRSIHYADFVFSIYSKENRNLIAKGGQYLIDLHGSRINCCGATIYTDNI